MKQTATETTRQVAMWLAAVVLLSGELGAQDAEPPVFPPELVRFTPVTTEPVFSGAGEGHWDAAIRERGWIVREAGGSYRMYYTGYDGTRTGLKMLGMATSPDGIRWTRHPGNPIYADHWVEDMMIVRQDGTWFMFAEGEGDRAHLLTSTDGLEWNREGPIDVRQRDGRPLSEGPYGTPTAYFEDGTWYLFYERRDEGIWLATSTDLRRFTNLQDEPVLEPGPASYDGLMIAMNQVVRIGDRYYALYHGSGTPARPRLWCTCLASSTDLVHWRKYPDNPLLPLEENKSSGILVPDDEGRLRLYTMHGEVHVHEPR